jgi:very-short-patch-repair endonuclease
MLLPRGVRIVLEVDGQQHYAEGEAASPRLYSEMVAEDRRLRLRGYEVYRFGGHELSEPGADDMLRQFFSELLAPYQAG